MTPTCVDCGGPRSPHSHARCRACYKAHAVATAKTWHCPECGQSMSERKATRCLDCRRAAVANAKTAFIEDVEWLLSMGTAPADVLARLGTNANAAARRLYRYKRGDLAAVFEHLRGRRAA